MQLLSPPTNKMLIVSIGAVKHTSVYSTSKNNQWRRSRVQIVYPVCKTVTNISYLL
jgi:hypothetical protein